MMIGYDWPLAEFKLFFFLKGFVFKVAVEILFVDFCSAIKLFGRLLRVDDGLFAYIAFAVANSF